MMAKIDSILFKPKVGESYEVKVIKMLDFGAVVEYLDAPGNEVLLHVSELAWERTENVSDVVNMGDVFDVKYFFQSREYGWLRPWRFGSALQNLRSWPLMPAKDRHLLRWYGAPVLRLFGQLVRRWLLPG